MHTNIGLGVVSATWLWLASGCGGATGGVAFSDDGWEWIREEALAWQLVDDTLAIRTQPGSLWADSNNARNVRVRDAPDADAWFAQVELTSRPERGAEQGGLLLYSGDDDYVKLVHERVAGDLFALQASERDGVPMVADRLEADVAIIELRMLVSASGVSGWARQGTEQPWLEVATSELPPSPLRVGVFSHGGDEDVERWASFRGFLLSEETLP
ncbi:MAG: hypothetical protein KTR31_04590 [Myxococcales bacterium]|nr:hypothetical protein [Myxococcales bacterium]